MSLPTHPAVYTRLLVHRHLVALLYKRLNIRNVYLAFMEVFLDHYWGHMHQWECHQNLGLVMYAVKSYR